MTRVLAIALAAACAIVLWLSYRVDTLLLEAAVEQRNAAAAIADAQARAREVEQRAAEAMNAAAEQYERGKHDAEQAAERVSAGLRDGSLRLRREWAACETSRLSEGAAAERDIVELAQRRDALATAVVRVGADADAQAAALIAAYNGVRDRINRGPQE